MAEKKTILEEALLDIQNIQNALNANTKEILRSVAIEEIDGLVKESLEEGYVEEDADEETKQRWVKAYRDAEADTNKMIAKHGSVEQWYESGEGRLL